MINRNFGLDVIRTFAILPVLAVHYAAFALENPPQIVFVLGDLGVEIFFALSGFLIGGIILRDFERGFSWRIALNFYVRRWMRTLPLYYVFFGASAFVTIYGFTLDKAWSAKCFAYLLFLQNLSWPMLAQWYHESWSLAIEEWFYLVFPVFFAVLVGIPARARILIIALSLIVAPLALRIYQFDPSLPFDLYVRRIVVLRLDAIAFGILAIWSVRTFPTAMRYWKNVIGLAGAAGALITIEILMGRVDVGMFFLRTFSFTLASASFAAVVIWAYFQSWTYFEAGGESKVISWFSTRSYALYLCHGSVVRTMLRHGWFAEHPVVSFLIGSS
ncbi:acyltransferase [Burkholderia vietnamiensis]|uniref:acyltransferase family protein n=1 Tax=Burkholderia vietnamiensis TaxID=60552 RepID=UPI001593DD3D|nr:acyltransferase [Burkholderia vietnamiensis]WHU91058.1 acyltransferase [Burkholderia vietnamiensis]